jgi:glycosyltransferase involved in cell wall biosynthesis
MFACETLEHAPMAPAGAGRTQAVRVMNVLYVSFTEQAARPYLDASTRYRCFHAVEAARALGHRAFITTQAALRTTDPALFDLVVVHRPAATPELVRFLRAGRAAGTRLVADYDDLIFDAAYAEASAMSASSWNLPALFERFKRNKDALTLFTEFTVATAAMRDRILELHPSAAVQVLPNAVAPSLWSMIASRSYQHQTQRPCIGYFPGEAANGSDLAIAAAGLAKLCRSRRIPLRIVGPTQATPAALRGVEVERMELLPFSGMFDALSKCRVVIAPFKSSPLNRARPQTGLLEALLSCTACVATASPDAARHRDGLTAAPVSLVDDGGDWAAALEERWDGFDLAGAMGARDALVRRSGAVQVYTPLFGAV